ncbi:aminotransferase class V-fold PLP-dependent enzyme [Gudongella sp. DL1XJH-153]|uniref:aminotransferase class V-fold PLP-dependent enzyme n=1 Tax=Gudongella sp. DL1XJH-153 TaxID=3409804 RepID=UPI003BB63A63
MYYLDNAATTFPKPQEVYDEIYKAMTEYGANPGRSGHDLALKASRGIYGTRDLIANLFSVENPMNIIFTHNCTESLNIAIKGYLKPGDHVLTTSMEHNSVLRPIKHLESIGVENTIVRADSDGQIDPEKLKKAIKHNTKLIVTTHVSNLTGTIMPVKEIGRVAKEHGITYLLDAAQSAGVYDIDVDELGVHMLAFPGHKGLLGPQGTGGLYIREGLQVEQFIQGGTGSASYSLQQPDEMPDKFESGTPNSPGIIGLGRGIQYILKRGIENIRSHEEKLTTYFLEEISKIDGIRVYGPCNASLQGAVVALNIRDLDSSEVSYVLNEEFGIYVRPGLHCAPLAHETIGTMEQGVVRFSFGPFNKQEELEYAIKALHRISKEI